MFLDFVSQMLASLFNDQNQVPQECYLEALSAAKYWCTYSSDTLVPNQQFIELIFNVIETQNHLFSKGVNILEKLLINYKNVKALDHMSEEVAFRPLPDQDLQFINLLVNFFFKNRQKFLELTQRQFDEEEELEESGKYARKFCQLLTTFCSNYEVFLIKQSTESESLFGMMKDCARSQN